MFPAQDTAPPVPGSTDPVCRGRQRPIAIPPTMGVESVSAGQVNHRKERAVMDKQSDKSDKPSESTSMSRSSTDQGPEAEGHRVSSGKSSSASTSEGSDRSKEKASEGSAEVEGHARRSS